MTPQQEILQKCTVKENVVYLPAVQLERNLYQEVAKALQHIGGKWKGGKVMGFIFPHDPTDLLAEIATGVKRNLKKETQFFATPASLAAEMVRHAELHPADQILEPSAGQGAILEEIIKYYAGSLDTYYIEKDQTNRMILSKRWNHYINVNEVNPDKNDFLKLISGAFDKIIANPPFSKNQDIDHIYKMWEVLKPGGRIVTIASKHWLLSSNKKETDFKNWLYNTVDATVNTVEAGTFEESGTKIETVMIIIDKPKN